MEREQLPPDERAVTTVSSPPDSAVGISDRFIGYLLLFTVLVFLLYVLPEVLVFKQYGFAPVERLDDTATNPSFGQILSSLWTDRAQVLNPMNNSLMRFFLVTMVVGVVFDRVKKYWPSMGDGS
jgi:hypothetical protein